MSSSPALASFRLEADLCLAQARAPGSAAVSPDSPAWDVVTDLTRTEAITIAPEAGLRSAEQKMRAHGVHMLFVSTGGDSVDGLLTSTDLHGDRQMRLLRERECHFDDLCVADLMTPREALDAVDFDALRRATVADLIATLKAVGRRHMLVVQAPTPGTPRRVRALISLNQIERQLGREIDLTPVATSFLEIEQALL